MDRDAAGGRRPHASARDLTGDPGAGSLREEFFLDPEVAYLNHGAFGACPRPVFEEYGRWQREVERNPVDFLGRRLPELLAAVRARLGAYVGADPEALVLVPNATSGLNVIARSLDLRPGDEVLATDHEYGAADLMWELVCRRAGATYVRRPVPVPVRSQADVVEAVWNGVSDRTRVLFLSHVTSATALVLPVGELCRLAREAGILAVVDGAHAPGQVPVDLETMGADAYAGNCHKWLCAPKGAGFLWVRPELHGAIDSLVIGWGWADEAASFVVRNEEQGTRDPAAYLAVPAAIDYLERRGWDDVRARCHELASVARGTLAELTGIEPLQPDSRGVVRPDGDGRAPRLRRRRGGPAARARPPGRGLRQSLERPAGPPRVDSGVHVGRRPRTPARRAAEGALPLSELVSRYVSRS